MMGSSLKFKIDEIGPLIRAYINAVETAKYAIVKIDVTKRKQNKKLSGSSGSGFFYSSDGYLSQTAM